MADKLIYQRKIWPNRICPTLKRRERKEKLLKRQCIRERSVLPGEFYRDRLERENKLDTGEDNEPEDEKPEEQNTLLESEVKQSNSEEEKEKPDWISQLGEEFELEQLAE